MLAADSLPGAFVHSRKEHKPKLLNPDILRWGRGLPREGVGAKKFDMPLETREIKLFWRDIPGCCWDIPAVPEKFENKKRFVFDFWPLKTSLAHDACSAGGRWVLESPLFFVCQSFLLVVFLSVCVVHLVRFLSGRLNRLNAILSLLHYLDRYRTPSAIGSAILSRPISHPNTGGSPQPPHSKPLGGLNRAIVVL